MDTLRVTAKSLPTDSRQRNRALVLRTLFHDGPLTRPDLAHRSGLTRVTIADLIAELADERVIVAHGTPVRGTVGKPAQTFEFNEDAYRIVCLDLAPADRFDGAVTTLRGKIIERAHVSLEGVTGAAALDKVRELARTLVSPCREQILGIGISSPGIVANGTVRQAPNLGWYDQPLAAILSTEFVLPTHVSNDANASALALHTLQPDTSRSLMLVTIEHGVGAALIVGDSLVEGEQNTAGEIGHVVVDENGERCSCGRRGCVELTVSVPRLKQKVEAVPAEERERVLDDAGRALGIALAPIVAALNLNEVLLAGPTHLINGSFLSAVARTIRERTLSAVSHGLHLRAVEDSATLRLRGAAAVVLRAELGIS